MDRPDNTPSVIDLGLQARNGDEFAIDALCALAARTVKAESELRSLKNMPRTTTAGKITAHESLEALRGLVDDAAASSKADAIAFNRAHGLGPN